MKVNHDRLLLGLRLISHYTVRELDENLCLRGTCLDKHRLRKIVRSLYYIVCDMRIKCKPCPDDCYQHVWWRQMETFSALLAICVGNSPVRGEFRAQRPVTRSLDAFFDLRPNIRLSKQSWGWWFETTSCSLWRLCNRLGPLGESKFPVDKLAGLVRSYLCII